MSQKASIYSIRDVIEKFDRPANFARAVGAPPGNGRVWYRRNRIPAKYHGAAIEALKFVGVTMEPQRLKDLCQRGRGQGY